MSAHPTPRQIRSRLDHPVIHAAGHWIEYASAFREELHKFGGDAAVRAAQ